MSLAQMVHFVSVVTRILTGNPVLEVEPTSEYGCTATKSGQNGNKTIASITFYRPCSRGDNTFGIIHVRVCPFVCGYSPG